MKDAVALIRFELTVGRRRYTHEVPATSALLGSAAHCDVQLSPEVSAAEQLIVEWTGRQLEGRLLSPGPTCTIDGSPYAGGPLSDGAELAFGDTRVRVCRVVPAADRRRHGTSDGWSWPVRLAGLAVIAVGGLYLLRPAENRDVLAQTVAAPQLFSPEAPSCPATGAAEAAFAAQRLLRDAWMRHERAPFFPHDGVMAVAGYRKATACYQVAGDDQAAMDAQRRSEQLQTLTAEQFHIHQVRLDRFLRDNKPDAAKRELMVLQDFLRDRHSPYTDWLSAVERELRLRFGSSAHRHTNDTWRMV